MKRIVLGTLLLSAALLVLSACGDVEPASNGGGAFELSLPPLHAEPDPTHGGRVIDALGREVLLRGVNVNALAEYWQGSEFPTVFPLTGEDIEAMAGIGWNVVRLLISWSLVEPEPGRYDGAYLERVGAAIDDFARHGIYTLIDLHQDAWGPTLAARPEEECPPGSRPAIGWDGAPGWATFDEGAARCAPGGVRELSPAVEAAFNAFWRDVPGPAGVGIRTRYVRMLGELVATFANREGVIGYDLMNEPNALRRDVILALSEFYAEAGAEIRAREASAGGRSNLIFFEPSVFWSAIGMGPPEPFEHDGNVVYAPHVYTGGFTGLPITERAFQIARDEAVLYGGAPVFSGEWGGDPARASDPDDGYFLDHMGFQDQFRFGSTLWTWRESCGDPHKVGELLAGGTPVPWGEFDVDCSTNEVLGPRADLIEQLRRATLRAAPGKIDEVRYDDASGEFIARGFAAAPDTELIAFYPSSKHADPLLDGSGLSDLRTEPAPGGNVYVVARSSEAQWSLRVTVPGASE